MITPEEIAVSIVHFLSDEFGPISGQVIELLNFLYWKECSQVLMLFLKMRKWGVKQRKS